MLRRWLLLVFVQHVIFAQDTHLQKIADSYSAWATASPYNPHASAAISNSRPVRQFTHMVTVEAPPVYAQQRPEPISFQEPHSLQLTPPAQSQRPRFIHIPMAQPEPPIQRVQPQPQPLPITRTIQPQYSPALSPSRYPPHVGLPPTLRNPNNTFLLPQRIRKPSITEEDEARNLAGKRQKWGRPAMEISCEFGFCGGNCCSPPPSIHHQEIHAAALPGSNLQHPVLVVLHPSPPQCAPACLPMCHVQCTSRLQYLPMAMPEFFHPHHPTCRSDCMPSCHVDCLILPPMVIRCNSFPCRCGAGYRQCTPFSCCSAYMNMRSKFRSMVEDKSEEEVEKETRRRKKMRAPLNTAFNGGGDKAVISGDSETAMATISTPTISATTQAPTTTTPTTTTTTTTTTIPPTTTTTRRTTTTPARWIKPIYPEVPLVPIYGLWQPKEQIMKAKAREEEESFIRSNSFVEMLAELAQVKAKEDLDMTAEDFLSYLTETGK